MPSLPTNDNGKVCSRCGSKGPLYTIMLKAGKYLTSSGAIFDRDLLVPKSLCTDCSTRLHEILLKYFYPM